jgi:HAE1 family hydrophobic/amphiphilic exporter-1
MVGLAVLSFAGALWLQFTFGGADLIPKSDRSELNIVVETPPGSNLDYMRLKIGEIERVLRSHPEVQYTYSTVGSPVGSGEIDSGSVYVRLVPRQQRHVSQETLSQTIRPELSRLGGVTAFVFEPSPGGNRKQIQIKLRDEGAGYATLSRFASQVMSVVRQVPGATDIGLSTKGDRPELEIDLDRPLAATMGISVSDVAASLRPAFAGLHAGDWVDPTGKTRDVTVRFSPEARTSIADLEQLPLLLTSAPSARSPSTIPLGAIASITTAFGPAAVQHFSGDEVISVEANVAGRSLSEVSNDINARVQRLVTPPGIRITQGGEVSDQAEVYGDIIAALGLAVLLMYLILVVQFGSFLDPLTIMMSLPLSLIGVVLALMITGETLNILSMIGVILLMGIVTKNAILLVDFAIWAKERKHISTRDALIEAGRIRLRPILMTTMALIAGMLPVAIGAGVGGDFRRSLGIAVIGGVITSTVLTLLVVPTFYEILDGVRASVLGRLAGARRRSLTAVPEAAPGD